MARIEIKLTGTSPGNRTEITVERLNELQAVGEAIGLLLASYGSEIRAAMAHVRTVAKLFDDGKPEGAQPE